MTTAYSRVDKAIQHARVTLASIIKQGTMLHSSVSCEWLRSLLISKCYDCSTNSLTVLPVCWRVERVLETLASHMQMSLHYCIPHGLAQVASLIQRNCKCNFAACTSTWLHAQVQGVDRRARGMVSSDMPHALFGTLLVQFGSHNVLDWLWAASAHASRRWAGAVRLGDACSSGVAAYFDVLAGLVRLTAAGAAWLARSSIH